MTEPRYPFVHVDVPAAEVDEASARLFELGAAGVEERDATTLQRGAPGLVTLIASFERDDEARVACAAVPPGWNARVDAVVGDAWRDEWKKHFEPFLVCPGVVIRPPWREHAAAPGERVVVLEPGRAFGTGLHETTSLVAERLAATPLAATAVLDVGCGSGILGLVALALGATRVRAVDVDPEAVATSRENAERNGMASLLEADDAALDAIGEVFPLVVANIEATTLVELAPALVPRVAPGGLLVLSGILAPDVAPAQLANIQRAYGALRSLDVTRKGEWIAVAVRH